LVSAALFGAATPVSKVLLADIQVQVLAGLLYLGATVGVLPAAVRAKPMRLPWQAGRRTLILLGGAILLGGIAGPLLLLLGLKNASAGSVSLWLNLEFVATVLLGHFVFRDYMTLRGWIAAAGTLVAAVLLVGAEGDPGLRAVMFVAGACLCWGFDNHLTALIDGITPAQATLWKGAVAGVFNLVIGGVLVGGIGSPGLVTSALIVGALAYGLSVTLYISAAQGLGAIRSQMIFSTAPFFGFLMAVGILGESFTGLQILAAVIIIASLVILFREQHHHSHRHVAFAHRHDHAHDDAHHAHAHEAAPRGVTHSHWHEHEAAEHDHGHWPDLHHRHRHHEDGADDK
jgi:drug/metabolite transporter (DMT)-like permease